MCRVRFGLTDIHFEECQPTLPRRTYYRQLVSAVPAIEKRKLGPLIPTGLDEALSARKKTAVIPPTSDVSRLSGPQIQNKRERRKRRLSSSGRRSKGSSSSSQSSTSSSFSGDGPHDTRLGKPAKEHKPAISFHPCAKPSEHKPATFFTPSAKSLYLAAASQNSDNHYQSTVSKIFEQSNKPRPAKKVRFAIDMQATASPSNVVDAPSDSSSTHSSQESMIDTGPFPQFRAPSNPWARQLAGPIAGRSAQPSLGLTARPLSGPSHSQSNGLPFEGPSETSDEDSSESSDEESVVSSHKKSIASSQKKSVLYSKASSNASSTEPFDAFSGYYRSLDAPRTYKNKVQGPKSSAKPQPVNVTAKNISLVPAKRSNQDHSASSTRPNGSPNRGSRFSKLRPAKKLPRSILKTSSKFFGTKGKEHEKKPKGQQSPSFSDIDEENERESNSE